MKPMNLVTLTFQNGQDATLEAFIFADMVKIYQKAMTDRQAAIAERLTKLNIGDVHTRMEEFKALCREHDDSQIRLHGVQQADKAFRENIVTRAPLVGDHQMAR